MRTGQISVGHGAKIRFECLGGRKHDLGGYAWCGRSGLTLRKRERINVVFLLSQNVLKNGVPECSSVSAKANWSDMDGYTFQRARAFLS